MKEQWAFVDKEKGEEIIVIGNGPGLKNIPPAFLMSRVNIGINYIREYYPFIKLDHWLTIDKECLPAIPYAVPAFVPFRFMSLVTSSAENKIPNVIPMILWKEIEGIPWSPSYGSGYTTSLAAAVHLAVFVLGAPRVFVVGFDCTFPLTPLREHVDGKSNLPHFYHDEGAKVIKMHQWDNEMGYLRTAVEDHGAEIINLSVPTESETLFQDDYRIYWRPNEH